MLQSEHLEAHEKQLDMSMKGSEIVEEYGEQEVSVECEVQKPGEKCEEVMNLPVRWKAETILLLLNLFFLYGLDFRPRIWR